MRFNPGLWPSGTKMTDRVGREMFALCGERNAPVGFMCFHGLDLSIEEIETLCTDYPETPVLMDHFGFCKGARDPNWRLLGLARFPQVSVKASAQFRVTPEGANGASWPYSSTGEQLRELIDTFGAERVVWGSDFPFVLEQCGYSGETPAAGIIARPRRSPVGRGDGGGDGGNLRRMFPGAWSR